MTTEKQSSDLQPRLEVYPRAHAIRSARQAAGEGQLVRLVSIGSEVCEDMVLDLLGMVTRIAIDENEVTVSGAESPLELTVFRESPNGLLVSDSGSYLGCYMVDEGFERHSQLSCTE